MIQGVISRMSGFSATAKNFAVTVLVALVAVAFDKGAHLFWTGVGALLAFFAMDFYYHLLEVRFRELYQSTARSPLDPPSDMALEPPQASGAQVWRVIKSLALIPFYVLLLFAFGIALYEGAHVSAKLKPHADAARNSGSVAGKLDQPERANPAGTAAEPKRAGKLSKQPAEAAKQ